MLPHITFATKRWLEAFTGLSSDSLHVLLGLLLFPAAWYLSGRRPWVAVALIAGLELINETLDWRHHGSWRPLDTAGDVLNSLLLPCLIAAAATLLARRNVTLVPAQPTRHALFPRGRVLSSKR